MKSKIKDTQVVILCGGKGERLMPLTKYCCKPMLEVAGKPILQWQVDHLLSLGFKMKNIIFLAGYRGQDIKRIYGKQVITEKTQLGTAGAVMAIKNKIHSKNFFVLYGDIISLEDHADTLLFHEQENAIATIKYHYREVPSEIRIDVANNQVYHFEEHSQIKVNSDMYCFSRKIFDYIPALPEITDFPVNVFPRIEKSKFYAIPIRKYRISINTKERLAKAESDMLKY